MLAWLSVRSEVQTCIRPSWCHCHSLSLASVKSRLVLPFWYRPTRVVPNKRQLNVCYCCCWWQDAAVHSAVIPAAGAARRLVTRRWWVLTSTRRSALHTRSTARAPPPPPPPQTHDNNYNNNYNYNYRTPSARSRVCNHGVACAPHHRPISSCRRRDVQQWATAPSLSQHRAPGTVCRTRSIAPIPSHL